MLLYFFIVNLNSFEIDKVTEFSFSETYGTEVSNLIVKDNYLYSLNSRSLQIFDIQANSFQLINDFNLEGQTRKISLKGNYAYASKGGPPENRLYRIDISDVMNLSITDTLFYLGSYAHFIDGNNVFVHELLSDWTWKVHVYDNDTFQQITEFMVPQLYGTMHHVIEGIGIVRYYEMAALYDISDPFDIELISESQIGTNYFPFQSTIIQDSVLVYGDHNGIRFYDINEGNDWQLISNIEHSISDFRISNNKLVSIRGLELYLYNIENICEPVMLDSIYFTLFNNQKSITIHENISYIATGLGKLTSYSIAGNFFEEIDTYYSYGRLESAYLYADNLIIPTILNGLNCWDITDFEEPTLSGVYYGNYFPANYSNGEENIMVYTCYDIENMVTLNKVLQIEDNGDITEVDELTSTTSGSALFYKQGTGFFIVSDEIIYKYNLNENNELEEVASISIPGVSWGEFYFLDDIAYIISWEQLSIINNINNNETIELYDQIYISVYGPDAVCFFQNYLFISEQVDISDCLIFDITDPLSPVLMTTLEKSGLIGIDEENELLFMGSSTCNVFDLSTIETGIVPEIYSFLNWNYCQQVIPFKRNNEDFLIYLEGTSCSIYQYDYEPNYIEDEILTIKPYLTNYPNPFNPETKIIFNLPEEGNVKLEIYNIKGQKVKTLMDCYTSPGDYELIWDGRDDNRKQVGSGVYFYQLILDGKILKTRKALLLK